MDTKQLYNEYIANTYKRFDAVFVSGRGSVLTDEGGREYIDLGGGIAVNTMGLSDESWADAVCAQVRKLAHTSNLYYVEPQAELAQKLCERTGMKRVFFSNSGAEANECMIKSARKYSSEKNGNSTIVTLGGSFHGRTITTLSATGQTEFHRDFGPFTQGFVHVQPGDLDELRAVCDEHDPCAVMIELIQGEGGVVALDKDYVAEIEKLCRERGMLFAIDEIQTGNGRTGALYAYMKYGVEPDMITTAKGLAGGLPLGATLFGNRVKDVLDPGSHGSTFGGNPVCAAGALNILDQLDDALLDEVDRKGRFTADFLSGIKGVESVSGMGLMLGAKTERPAAEIAAACLENGVAVLTAKDKVRLLPALNIPHDVLEKGLEIVKEVIEK